MYIVWIILIAVIAGGIASFLWGLSNKNDEYAKKCNNIQTAEKYRKWADENRRDSLVVAVIGIVIIVIMFIW